MDNWGDAGEFSYGIPVSPGTISQELLRSGNFECDYSKEAFDKDRTQLIRQMCMLYSREEIDKVFNARTGTFSRSVFDAEEDERGSKLPPFGISVEAQARGDLSLHYSDNTLSFFYERGAREEATLRSSDLFQRIRLEGRIQQAYSRFLFQDTNSFFVKPNCSTSARLAISLFYSEIESNRRFTVRQLQQAKGGHDLPPEEIIRRYTSRYALPIDDEIDFVKTIPDFPADWKNLDRGRAEKDLEKIVGGSFTKSDDILYFIPSERNHREKKIPLHLSSSSAVEMSRLFFNFVLKGEDGGTLLIIDEPESHLDPMNQILLARALVRWANSGMMILISTHSDYIVKEISNLIMLNGSFDEKEKLLESLGYEEGDSIDPSKIKAYYAVDGGLKECSKNAFGIEVPSFEDSIDELIRVSGVLGSRIILEEGEDE